jgi:hypothetical protein
MAMATGQAEEFAVGCGQVDSALIGLTPSEARLQHRPQGVLRKSGSEYDV